MHCPSAKANNSAIENNIFVEIAAIAIMLASIGDEQGLEARAKNAPVKNGNINKLPDLFWGIFFTIAGNCISTKPKRFNPIITMTEANSSITTGEVKLVKALPVIAHITPIILKTADNPTEKDSICINNFLLLSFEYPPTYPIIKGNIPNEHGESDARIPAKNAIIIKIGIITPPPAEY